ncbi:MAG: DUF1330 domain-containing protein [Paracoccaceae bacterium]|nr:DUF1330 domain-containing protein [Paracoccaceae bacterium]
MTKGYWVAHADISDPQAYEAYKLANALPFAKYGARFLVRGGAARQVEGTARARCVVIEFDSLATAIACYDSPEYQAAKALRDPASTADVTIVEGWGG